MVPSPPIDVRADFFTSVSNGNVANVADILKKHPEALEWRYTLNGLNQPVTMIAHDLPMLKFLLGQKADPNAADRTGNTRLIECGDGADSAKLLLEHGADADKANERGLTPLMRAAFNKCTSVARVLMEAGANPDLRNIDGKTAEMIARERFFPELADEIHTYTEQRHREQAIRDAEHFRTGAERDIGLMRPLKLKASGL